LRGREGGDQPAKNQKRDVGLAEVNRGLDLRQANNWTSAAQEPKVSGHVWLGTKRHLSRGCVKMRGQHAARHAASMRRGRGGGKAGAWKVRGAAGLSTSSPFVLIHLDLPPPLLPPNLDARLVRSSCPKSLSTAVFHCDNDVRNGPRSIAPSV
jgi:hypothetical protein